MSHTPENAAVEKREEVELSENGINAERTSEEEAPEVPVEEGMEDPKGFKLAMVILALVLSVFLISLDLTIISTAIPRITDEFHSLDQVGWYGSAFFLTLACFQSTWGKAYKYFLLKIGFLCGIGTFELGSLICGIARNSSTLIAGRAIAGLGAAGVSSGCYIIIAFAAPPRLRPAFTGILGATYGCASVVGPLLGGVFTDKVTWRWCFYINLPLGMVSGLIIGLLFKTPPAAAPVEASFLEKFLQMDLIGTLTIIAASICYLLAMEWGGITKSWNSSDVIGVLVTFAVLLFIFVFNEWKQGDRGILSFNKLSHRTIAVMCVFVSFLSGAFFVILYYLPIYFQAVNRSSAAESGIRTLPLIIACSIASVLSGGLISAFGHYVPFLIAGSVLSTIGAGLIFTLQIESKSSHWIGYQTLAGIGMGLVFQLPIIVTQSVSDPSDVSHITAITLFFQMIGAAFFISAAQSAFANRLIYNLQINVPEVDPIDVVAVGATQFRSTFPLEFISGILTSYMDSLHVAFAIAIALAAISVVVSFFAEFRKIQVRL